jgi:hypothetical protein
MAVQTGGCCIGGGIGVYDGYTYTYTVTTTHAKTARIVGNIRNQRGHVTTTVAISSYSRLKPQQQATVIRFCQ